MWEREAEFKQLLSKCSSKASKSAIDSLTQLAIEDHALCYKAVPLLMEKQLRRSASGQQRANIMYAVSKLLRESKRELKGRSKYAERFMPLLPAMFKSLAEALPSSERHGLLKLLSSWRKEGILPEQHIASYEAALPPAAMAEAAKGQPPAGWRHQAAQQQQQRAGQLGVAVVAGC
ncbi:hypothetical protein COO60DRAFT_195638 [Scenedesmus sp. NREL 46B-D3]|nr:hypothetical protein COO60DRAFT_195638 [Scenedesmus sp. NREL 46B-D3]